MVCQVLKNYFQMCSCLGRPSHERHNSWQGSNVEILYPEKFQDLESQVLNSAIIVKTWGHGVAKKWNMSELGIPSLEKKSELGLPSLEKYFQMCLRLGRPSHERHNSGKGLMLIFFTPESFKTWKAKSWIVQFLSRLQDMELQKKNNSSRLGIPSLERDM